MFGVKKVFKKTKTNLYYIEIDDDKIDTQILKIIIQIQKKTAEFKSHINENTLTIKEEWLSQIYELMIKVNQDTKELQKDVDKIINIELKNKDFLIIKDDNFLTDKKNQLSIMNKEIEDFIIIVEQRPSKQALQSELLEKLIKQINSMNKNIKEIIDDDNRLQEIYKKLNEI